MSQSLPASDNCWVSSKYYVAEKLAEVAAFWEFVFDPANVAASIFVNEISDPPDGHEWTQEQREQHLQRYAIVTSPTNVPFRAQITDSRRISYSGIVQVVLTRIVTDRERNEWDNAYNSLVFESFVGDIFQELNETINDDRPGWLKQLEIAFGLLETPDQLRDSQGHEQNAILTYGWADQ